MLKELELINFMSHKYSKLLFHKGLNVLIGRKGSGKTAVLEAIRLLFGGLGRERLSRLGAFIRYGENKAIIRAKISNSVRLKGRVKIRLIEELPDTADIVLERIIYSDGRSIFKLNGKQVPKHHIIKMFSKVNISPRNILFFLPQERINEWFSITPAERVNLIMSALGLKELKEKLDLVREEINKRKRDREYYEKLLKEYEDILRQKEKELVPPKEARDKIVRYYILRIAYLITRKINIEKEKNELKEKFDKIDNEFTRIHNQIKLLEEKRDQIDKEIEELRIKREELLVKERVSYEYELKEAEKKISNYQAKLAEIREKYEKELLELEEIRRVWGSADIDELKQLIEDKRARIAVIENEMSSDASFLRIKQLENEIDQLMVEKNALMRELENARESIKKVLNILDPKGVLESIYHKIRSRSGLSDDEVIGPIILALKIRLPSDKILEYGKVIERALGHKLLASFIALNRNGYQKLLKLLREAKNYGNIDIITFSRPGEERIISPDTLEICRTIVSEALDRRRKLKEKAERVLGGMHGLIAFWLCDIIDAPIPVKAIIESRNWDVPIVIDIPAASIVLDKLNLKKAVTLDGEIIEKRVDPLTKNIIYVTKPTWIREPDSNIFSILYNFDLEKIREYEEEILSRIALIDEEIRRLRREIDNIKRHLPDRIRALDAERRRLEEEINNLLSIIGRVNAIRKRLETIPEDRRKILHTIELLQKRIDELTDKLSQIESETALIDHKIEELSIEREKIMEEYSDLLATLKLLEREKEEIPARLKALEREAQMIDDEITRTKKELYVLFEILKRVGEYPREAKLDEIIEKEIIIPAENLIETINFDELREEFAYLEKRIESLKENVLKMESKLSEIKEALEKIHEYKEKLRNLDEEISEIRRFYEKELKEIMTKLHEKIEEINHYYNFVLNHLGAHGEVKIYGKSIDELELRITIDLHREKPVEIDKGGFSSGEKSTAIMALIIAMMLSSPTPIFMFDEFDVYLDDQSLIEVMRLIKTALKDFQGIIITTHREEIISEADRIFYMEYNEKAGQTQILQINKDEILGSMYNNSRGGLHGEEYFSFT